MKKLFWSITSFEVVLVLSVLLVGTASFGLGRFSALREVNTGVVSGEEGSLGGVEIRNMKAIQTEKSSNATLNQASSFDETSVKSPLVASKNGTKYYFSTCSGASRIAEKNKIIFQTPEEAERAGYTLASGCGQ